MEPKTEAELVLIPAPFRGHIVAALEMAKHLISRDHRLSITVLLIKPISDPKTSTHSYTSESNSRIRFVNIPWEELTNSPVSIFSQFVESHKGHVRNAVSDRINAFGPNSRLAGFVLDIFCIGMMDVADEFGVPTYAFYTSGAASLGLVLHFQGLKDYQNQDLAAYENSSVEIPVPSYKKPVPAKALPKIVFDRDGGGSTMLLDQLRRFRQAKGILVNTFLELESHALDFLSDDEKIPPVHPIGPILYLDNGVKDGEDEIIQWLDGQPDSSVVFLCFGSEGTFDENQVKLIATALERCGHRFLWSLRKPPTAKGFDEYGNPSEVLPKGFLERTAGVGKVIGWAPQAAVLSHPAVGGFVSHCGWNSTLESMWFGVPMATWPLYAEQQVNALQLVKELGVAEEIKIEYRKGANMVVTAEEIENAIRRLMEPESEIRENMKALKMEARKAVLEGGSSYGFVGRYIDEVMDNIV